MARYNSLGILSDTAVGIAVDNHITCMGRPGFNPLIMSQKYQPILSRPDCFQLERIPGDRKFSVLNGNVNPQGTDHLLSTACPPTSYGATSGTNAIGSSNNIVPVTAGLTGLNSGTLYHRRLVAVNIGGTTFGSGRHFHNQRRQRRAGHYGPAAKSDHGNRPERVFLSRSQWHGMPLVCQWSQRHRPVWLDRLSADDQRRPAN